MLYTRLFISFLSCAVLGACAQRPVATHEKPIESRAPASQPPALALEPFSLTEQVKVIEELHPIFTEPEVKSRAPASTWPTEFAEDFVVEAPSNRAPAAVRDPKNQKNKLTKSQIATGRRSRLPVGVNEGFEIRVKSGNLVTTFWVVKRGLRHELLYANSAGSQSAVGLSPESFRVVQNHASRIPASETDVRKCADNSMQLHYVTPGRPERTSTFCLDSKAKAADQLRMLGNTLVVWVR